MKGKKYGPEERLFTRCFIMLKSNTQLEFASFIYSIEICITIIVEVSRSFVERVRKSCVGINPQPRIDVCEL